MPLKHFTSGGKRYSVADMCDWPLAVRTEEKKCREWYTTRSEEQLMCAQPECRSEGTRRYVASPACGLACRACRDRIKRRETYNTNAPRRAVGCNDGSAMNLMGDLRARLVANSEKMPSGCIEWRGRTINGGYGITHLPAGEHILVHRLALLAIGVEIGQNFVLHSCDNPACINPDHLRPGSAKDNVADMDTRGRRNTKNVGEHLRDRDRHPKARAVDTPAGRFPSAALAAEHHGYSRAHGSLLAKTGTRGWMYCE